MSEDEDYLSNLRRPRGRTAALQQTSQPADPPASSSEARCHRSQTSTMQSDSMGQNTIQAEVEEDEEEDEADPADCEEENPWQGRLNESDSGDVDETPLFYE